MSAKRPRHKTLATIAGTALCILLAGSAEAKSDTGLVAESKYFSQEKIYTEDNYVLHDYLEFSVFDMSQLELFVEGAKVDLQPKAVKTKDLKGEAVSSDQPVLPTPTPQSDVEATIRQELPEIPKLFYKNLKRQIFLQKIPVTLSASDAPPFARPLKLFIKLKRVALERAVIDKKGQPVREVAAQIYGQIKDKKTDKILMRFYDVESIAVEAGPEKIMGSIDLLAQKMMADFSAFLKNKY